MPEQNNFPSTGDQRTENSTVRHQYRTLTDAEKASIGQVKELGETFLNCLETLQDSRENSISKIKIEEAVMWAVKGITK